MTEETPGTQAPVQAAAYASVSERTTHGDDIDLITRLRASANDWAVKCATACNERDEAREERDQLRDMIDAAGRAASSGGKTPGQAARSTWDAWWATSAERGRGKPGYDEKADTDAGWEVSADAGIGASGLRAQLAEARRELAEVRELAHNIGDLRQIDALTAERDKLGKALEAFDRLVFSQARTMYAAHIDTVHGDPNDATAILLEAIDGWDGPQWNGTETGTQWLERTRDDGQAFDSEDVPRCIRCGCTDEQACPGGCTWVPGSMDGDLCSRCAEDGEGGPDPSVVRNLLLLVGEDIPVDRITGWSPEDRAQVAEWAGREHLSASDNPVERCPRPSLLGGDGA